WPFWPWHWLLSDTEAFPSCLCLAGLQYVNGLGELAGTPGAAAELAENSPRLELGICALAGCAEPGVGAVGLFLRFRLALPDVLDLRVVVAPVVRFGLGDQARGLQLTQDAPAPLGFLVVHCSGQRSGHPQDVPDRAGDDLQVHPVLAVLAGIERTVRGDPVHRDQRAVQDHVRPPGLYRVADRLAQLRRPGCEQLRRLAESAWSAVPALPLARFSRPLAEPAVRLSAQRALHGSCRQVCSGRGQGLGILLPRYRCRVTGIASIRRSSVLP